MKQCFWFCCVEMKGVVWKKVGQSLIIQCRTESDQDFLNLKMETANEETGIVGIDKATERRIVLQGMTERVQTYGAFPNVDIIIKNLNGNDTGSYWCLYSKTSETFNQQITKGDGSVLLFVTGESLFFFIKPAASKLSYYVLLDITCFVQQP